MAELDNAQVRQWAIKGAEQRLLEIAAEAAAIHETFPELRDRGGAQRGTGATETPAGAGARGRTNMSAAQRKAVSERMRKYWAARREGTAEDTSSGTSKGRTSGGNAKGGRAKGGGSQAAGGRPGPRKMSAAARKRISDAQKKRWAERRKAKS